MSDGRRNKKFSKMKDREKKEDPPIQPKILLKAKEKDPPVPSSQPQISIATREIENKSSQSPNAITIQTKDKDNTTTIQNSSSSTANTNQQSTNISTSTQPAECLIQPVPQMTRPITIISYTSNQINPNTTKVLQKTNTDFLVVGVIGSQGVGKSTILNLLATENTNYDFKQNLFHNKEAIFPVKIKPGKGPSLPRTESLHMFITEDRTIFLDLPPVLCNPSKKDDTANELDDIRNILLLLTICHLVIVVQDNYFNLNLIRLLQFAELSKSNHETKSTLVSDYFPNILFVKNKAKREDFLPANKEKAEQMIRYFFKDSQMRIYFGQTDKQKRKDVDTINYFVFPEITDDNNEVSIYHPKLNILVDELRSRVSMTPRNQIYNGNGDLTEALWFELLTLTAMGKNDFFLTTYEDTRRYYNHGDQTMKNNNLNLGNFFISFILRLKKIKRKKIIWIQEFCQKGKIGIVGNILFCMVFWVVLTFFEPKYVLIVVKFLQK